MGTSQQAEDLDDDFPKIDEFGFAPFDDHYRCTFEYGGIEEFCTNEATHYIAFDVDDARPRMYRCDDHGFPFIVRARKRQELGRPVACENCRAHGRIPPIGNEVDGTVGILADGEEHEVHVCEPCAEANDWDIELLD